MPTAQVLLAAVHHSSEAVRVDCLELVAVNPKPTEPPGTLELQASVITECAFELSAD